MKRVIQINLSFIFCLLTFISMAQIQYTPYDELPTVNKMDKPSYSESYPSWAQKLYQYPINFNEICEEFNEYMTKNSSQKNDHHDQEKDPDQTQASSKNQD